MDKTICDDCEKEAAKQVKHGYFCKDCAMRVLWQDSQRDEWGLGVQRKPDPSMSLWGF
jgi:hypothetical protein